MIPILEKGSGVTFAIKVHSRAKKNAITGEVGDTLMLSLTSPPVDRKANQASIEFFANLLKVPRSSITIASGQTSRNKVIRAEGLSSKEVGKRLRMESNVLYEKDTYESARDGGRVHRTGHMADLERKS